MFGHKGVFSALEDDPPTTKIDRQLSDADFTVLQLEFSSAHREWIRYDGHRDDAITINGWREQEHLIARG